MNLEQPKITNDLIESNKTAKLRTPEETLEERKRRGERPVILHKKDGEQELVVIGLSHTLNLEKINRLKHLVREKHPDIFLRGVDIVIVEGTPVELNDNISPEQIIKEYGEQTYFASLAKEQGLKVEYWDTGFEENFKNATEKYDKDTVLTYFSSAILKILLENRPQHINEFDVVNNGEIEKLKEILKRYITAEMLNVVIKKTEDSNPIDEIDFENLFKKHCDKALADVTFGDIIKLSDPYEKGPTNEVIRYLNNSRDEKAMRVLEQSKQNHKSIFMTAGLDHVLAWEPVIDSLYKESISNDLDLNTLS